MIERLLKYKVQLGICCLWVLSICLVNPVGEFPLNDDWSYAKSVETLFNDGFLKLYNWGEMTLVAHVYWGYFFTKLFGFSFTALRLSSLLMGLFSILGVFQLALLVQPSRKIAFIGALLCFFNPIFFSLSFSFMTDVPFFAISVWTFFCFLNYHKTDQINYLIVAILLSIWAFLIRQLAFVFPLAWLIAFLLANKRNRQKSIIAFVPLIVLTLFYFTYTAYMKSEGLLQDRYNDKLGLLGRIIFNANPKLLVNIPGYLLVVLGYMGFFFAPLHWGKLQQNIQFKWSLTFTIIVAAALIYTGKSIPSLDNVLVDFGVGPITLFDHYGNFTKSPAPNAPTILWWVVTVIGVFFSSVWVFQVKELFLQLKKKVQLSVRPTFTTLSAIIYLTPFLIVGIYDRYLLFLIPLFYVLFLPHFQKKVSSTFLALSTVFIILLASFSVCATHDYLAWNRVRWKVLNQLNDQGVPLTEIQGGAEFTAWHHFDESNPKWWKAVGSNYVLVFAPLEGYELVESYEYNRWLPGDGKLYLMKN